MDSIIVIGGGIVGASAAYHLARAGTRVTLIDRKQPGQATAAGAGIIAPGTSFRPPAAFFPLAFRAVGYYPELLARLAEDGERETGYETIGLLHVATTPGESARLPLLHKLFEERRAAGVQNLDEVRLLNGQEARQLFPALGEIHGAIFVSGAARLDGRLMLTALHGAAQRHGAHLIATEHAATLVREGERVTQVLVDGQTFTVEQVILAAGAWSGTLLKTLGLDLPVYPQRGQILHLQGPVEAGRWPIVMGFHSHYLLTFPDGRVVAGATREDQSGFDVRVTASGAREVLNEALRIAPGLVDLTVHDIRVGLRPASPDGLPMLGRAPRLANVFLATGHGASGLQLGPYSGVLVAELALGRQPELDLTPFAVERFEAPHANT